MEQVPEQVQEIVRNARADGNPMRMVFNIRTGLWYVWFRDGAPRPGFTRRYLAGENKTVRDETEGPPPSSLMTKLAFPEIRSQGGPGAPSAGSGAPVTDAA